MQSWDRNKRWGRWNERRWRYSSTYSRILNLGTLKVKLPICLNQVPRHEDVEESKSIAPRILNLGSSWRWVSASRPGRFTPGLRTQYTLDKRLCGPQNWSDAVAKRRNSHCPCWELNPVRPGIFKILWHVATSLTIHGGDRVVVILLGVVEMQILKLSCHFS
jgi:hypothetical protein